MAYGNGLEKRERLCHLVPPDTIWCRFVSGTDLVLIWLCYPVPLDTKQFVGKMSAKDSE